MITDANRWRLPTYPGSDRVIAPGDRAGLLGADRDPDYVCTVESLSWDSQGWKVWDTDGNDRDPQWFRYVGPCLVTAYIRVDPAQLRADLDMVAVHLDDAHLGGSVQRIVNLLSDALAALEDDV